MLIITIIIIIGIVIIIKKSIEFGKDLIARLRKIKWINIR